MDCGETEVRRTRPLVGFNFKLETKFEASNTATGRCPRDALKGSLRFPASLRGYSEFFVFHLKLGQGKLAMGNAENSGESVHNNRDGRQQGTSEQRIRLVMPRLAPWTRILENPRILCRRMDSQQEKQTVQKLRGAIQAPARSFLPDGISH